MSERVGGVTSRLACNAPELVNQIAYGSLSKQPTKGRPRHTTNRLASEVNSSAGWESWWK